MLYAIVKRFGQGAVWRVEAEGLDKKEAIRLAREFSHKDPGMTYYVIDQEELLLKDYYFWL